MTSEGLLLEVDLESAADVLLPGDRDDPNGSSEERLIELNGYDGVVIGITRVGPPIVGEVPGLAISRVLHLEVGDPLVGVISALKSDLNDPLFGEETDADPLVGVVAASGPAASVVPDHGLIEPGIVRPVVGVVFGRCSDRIVRSHGSYQSDGHEIRGVLKGLVAGL